MRQNVVNIK